MISVTIDKQKYRVMKCDPMYSYSYIRQERIIDGVRLKVRELPGKYDPLPPSKKKSDRIWGQRQPGYPLPGINYEIIVEAGRVHSKLVYRGKKYDMYNMVDAELLYRKLSTELALENL